MRGACRLVGVDPKTVRHDRPPIAWQAIGETNLPRGGTKFTCRAILKRANENDVERHYVAPGKLHQNGFIESFSGSLRDPALAQHVEEDAEEFRREPAIRCERNITSSHERSGRLFQVQWCPDLKKGGQDSWWVAVFD